ncbi:Acyl-CoA-binding domain-containing protein 1 [Platanthera zijinensis]|uniref:Acyl-CoA-binding domain-containing protein 1 n=1 Tax=Platanthera zijinensis TaxID=2320716 RepID=A0AAP0FU35_9ASPA
MEFYQELLLTAVFSLLIAFLISKIAVVGNGDGERREDASVSSDRPASAEKSEGPSPEEADASAVQSGIEEERLDTEESEEGIEEEGSLLHWEDEWEGIEKSELEKLFSVATEYVVSSSGAVALAGLSSDVQMELYGLFKIATEGRCYEVATLPLNFSARTKWYCMFLHSSGHFFPSSSFIFPFI